MEGRKAGRKAGKQGGRRMRKLLFTEGNEKKKMLGTSEASELVKMETWWW